MSYSVASQDPFDIKECNVVLSSACGAVCLNRNFEALLLQKLGNKASQILTPRRLSDVMRYFDSSIKRCFNPYDSDCDTQYEVCMGGLDAIGIEDDYLVLSKYCTISLHFSKVLGMKSRAFIFRFLIKSTISSTSRCLMFKSDVVQK
jgi:hypothetical protein